MLIKKEAKSGVVYKLSTLRSGESLQYTVSYSHVTKLSPLDLELVEFITHLLEATMTTWISGMQLWMKC